jgi:tetratricopeptide (TPR) repeat protein
MTVNRGEFSMRNLFRFQSGSAFAMAVAAGVALSGFGLSAMPAYAAKGGGNSKEFIAAAGPIQSKVAELDKLKGKAEAGDAAAKAQLAADAKALTPDIQKALAVASTSKDKIIAGQYAVSVGGMSDDMVLRKQGVQAMLDSGELKPEQVPTFQFYLGNFAYGTNDFATASTALAAAAQGGVTDEQLVPLLVESYSKAGNTAEGLSQARKAIDAVKAAGKPVPEAWISRSVVVGYNGKAGPQTIDFAKLLVQEYPSKFNWLNASQMVRTFGNLDPQATLDLFRLMDRAGALDNDPKFVSGEFKEYIEAADPRRLPGEVVRIADKGLASGALSKTDQWVSDARTNAAGRIAADKASLAGQVASAMSSASGKVPQSLADAFLNYGENAKAEELYKAALGKAGSDRDLVLTRLGIVQYDQGKYAEAAQNFSQVSGARKPVADLWLLRIKDVNKGA